MTIIRVSAILLTIFFFSGCTTDTVAEKEKLLNTDRQFAASSVEKGAAEAFRMYLDENALSLPNKANPMRGRQSIYESMLDIPKDYKLEWTPIEADVAKSGELGYSWGKYTASWIDDSGQAQIRYGKYLNIWKKDATGVWKLLVDTGNSSPPPEHEN